MNAIEIRHLSKRYSDFLLDSVDFSVPEGTVLGLVGENGAGKSTVINLIMNTIKRDGGEVYVLGQSNTDSSFSQLKNDIGIVLDEAYFPEALTPANVNVIMKHTYKNWDEKKYNEYLQRFDLPRGKAFKEFSKGMEMKLAIAVALSHQPRLLILDEATRGLDPMARDEILDVFFEFAHSEGHSILLSSHIVSDLEKICDNIAFIHKGRMLFCEKKERLTQEYAIVTMTDSELEQLNSEAIRGKKRTSDGIEALVIRSLIPQTLTVRNATLEEIIIFLAREVSEA